MDVVWGETAGVEGQLLLLCPLLFLLQVRTQIFVSSISEELLKNVLKNILKTNYVLATCGSCLIELWFIIMKKWRVRNSVLRSLTDFVKLMLKKFKLHCEIAFFQGFEAYVGLLLLKTALDSGIPEWQACYLYHL